MFLRHGHGFFLAGLLLMSATATACADEGMWVFNNLPLGTLKARYGFEPPPLWAEHLRSSAVRFNNGGSGSFVSADGLIMTNHHVGADTLSKLGTKDKDYYRDGFFAKTCDEEAKAPDLELNVLAGIEDVTARVTAGVTAGMDYAAAEKARRKAMAEIEKESTDKTGLRSDVVTSIKVGSTIFIRTRSTPTSVWSSRPSLTRRSSAAIPTISSIPATISTFASFAPTRMASRPGRRIT